jgi:hypothetical protein
VITGTPPPPQSVRHNQGLPYCRRMHSPFSSQRIQRIFFQASLQSNLSEYYIILYYIIFQHPVALVSSIYVCISSVSGATFLFSLVTLSVCTFVLILVLHVSAVRHLQVLHIYLLAETAALFCSSLFLPCWLSY